MKDRLTLYVIAFSAIVFLGFATSSFAQNSVTYSIDQTAALLDEDYYSGADKNGSGPAVGLRNAFNSTPSPTGDRVAFRGVDLGTGLTALWVVDVSNPASWRRITVDGDVPLFGSISWTPDGQFLISNSQRINVATGAGAGVPFYTFDISDDNALNPIDLGIDESVDAVAVELGRDPETMGLNFNVALDRAEARVIEQLLAVETTGLFTFRGAYDINLAQAQMDLGPNFQALAPAVANYMTRDFGMGPAEFGWNFVALDILGVPPFTADLNGDGIFDIEQARCTEIIFVQQTETVLGQTIFANLAVATATLGTGNLGANQRLRAIVAMYATLGGAANEAVIQTIYQHSQVAANGADLTAALNQFDQSQGAALASAIAACRGGGGGAVSNISNNRLAAETIFADPQVAADGSVLNPASYLTDAAAELTQAVFAGLLDGFGNSGGSLTSVALEDGHVTAQPAGVNLGVAVLKLGTGTFIVASDINSDGGLPQDGGLGRAIAIFPPGTDIVTPRLSPDGSLIGFVHRIPSAQPDPGPGGFESDISDIYLIDNVDELMTADVDANGLAVNAINGLGDARLKAIRTTSEGGSRFKAFIGVSTDNSLISYSEDFNDAFVSSNTNFTGDTLELADFDVMLSRTDGAAISGANTSNDLRFPDSAQNAAIGGVTPGGLRITFRTSPTLSPAALQTRIFIASFVVDTVIDGGSLQDLDENSNEVVINGETVILPPEIQLTTKATQTTQAVEIADPSGAMVQLPADQVINFPEDATTQSISIVTPVAPTEAAELPDDAGIEAIPVKRTFGPAGTQFFPPIAITITYTEDEFFGLDETNIRPFLFNEATGKFDIPVPEEDIVSRDPLNNTVTFLVDHFSTYGLGAGTIASMPAADLRALLLLAGALLGASIAMRRRRAR